MAQKVEYADLDKVIYDLGNGEKREIARSEISPQSKIHVDGQTWINEQKAKKDADMRTMINDPKVPAAGAWSGPTAGDIENAITPSYSGNTPASLQDEQGNVIADMQSRPTPLPPVKTQTDPSMLDDPDMAMIDPKTGKPKWMSEYSIGGKPKELGGTGVATKGGDYGAYGFDQIGKDMQGTIDRGNRRYLENETRNIEAGIERKQTLEAAQEKEKEAIKAFEDHDPGEIGMWTNKDAGQKVLGGIAIMFGAIGDAMMQIGGSKGPGNMALKVIMDGVDDEIARQKELGENKRFAATLAGQRAKRLEDLGISKETQERMLQQNLLNKVDMQVRAYAMKLGTEEAKMKADQFSEEVALRNRALDVKNRMEHTGVAKSNRDVTLGNQVALFEAAQKDLQELTEAAKAKGETVEEKVSSFLRMYTEDKLPKEFRTQHGETLARFLDRANTLGWAARLGRMTKIDQDDVAKYRASDSGIDYNRSANDFLNKWGMIVKQGARHKRQMGGSDSVSDLPSLDYGK